MNGTALSIVLTAAFFHAGWNFLLKKSPRKILFTWWFLVASAVLFFPLFLYFLPSAAFNGRGWLCIFLSGTFHALYFAFMGKAYERGDLSLVYPIFRGTGPLLVPILAVLLLGERISTGGATGIALIVVGIFALHLRRFSPRGWLEPFLLLRGESSRWALLAGLAIAGYSLVDKQGVGHVFPVLYLYLLNTVTILWLSPLVINRYRGRILDEWRGHWRSILVVGFLAIFTYLMILFAMTLSPVSYVVAVREVSIVLSALFGILWLREQYGRQKLAGAFLIAAGVVLIGICTS